jgi:hypothetical protein
MEITGISVISFSYKKKKFRAKEKMKKTVVLHWHRI